MATFYLHRAIEAIHLPRENEVELNDLQQIVRWIAAPLKGCFFVSTPCKGMRDERIAPRY